MINLRVNLLWPRWYAITSQLKLFPVEMEDDKSRLLWSAQRWVWFMRKRMRKLLAHGGLS